jgi:hypothetical protein
VQKVYESENKADLLVEDPIVAAARRSCVDNIKALRISQSLLSEVTQLKM